MDTDRWRVTINQCMYIKYIQNIDVFIHKLKCLIRIFVKTQLEWREWRTDFRIKNNNKIQDIHIILNEHIIRVTI